MRMSQSKGRSGAAGFSLVELAIWMAVGALIMSAAILTLSRSAEATRTGAAGVALDTRATRLADEIADALRGASPMDVSVGGLAPEGSSWIEFRRPLRIEDGDVVFGGRERIELRPDPAGPTFPLAQEREVAWIRDLGTTAERTSIVARGVARSLEGEIPGNGDDDNGNGLVDEPGLCFDLMNGRVDVHVTLTAGDTAGRTLRSSAMRSVQFRNP